MLSSKSIRLDKNSKLSTIEAICKESAFARFRASFAVAYTLNISTPAGMDFSDGAQAAKKPVAAKGKNFMNFIQ
jgi:hypothetical protein